VNAAAPNAELAYRVLDHIDAHPELWNQRVYIGRYDGVTVACFAGRAALLSGAEPVYADDSCKRTVTVWAAGKLWCIWEYAVELLGISRIDVDPDGDGDLFEPLNTRADLGRLVTQVFGPRPGGAA
jgi:hypothetical protein